VPRKNHRVIPVIQKKGYDENQKSIATLESELSDIRVNLARYTANVSEVVNRELLELKEQKDRLLALRLTLASRLQRVQDNLRGNRAVRSENFQELVAIDQELASIDERMARSLNTVEAPTALVDRVAEVATKMKSAREENGRYEHEAELRAETKRLKELLQTEKETILVVIEKTINDGMRRIMTERFGPDRKSPYLQLRERSYSFEVEEDTGTGVAYTGLVLFDLTIFLLTRLPILVHDTVIFKNIENDSVSRLLPVYLETVKQSFIALDEIDKYGPETTVLLHKHRVLQLDTKNLLYIKDWRSRT
jgi:molybdopterin converting factor small subunit